MTASSSDEYVFRKTNDGSYVRKCFGIEIMGCKMAEFCDGFTHLNVSADVSIGGDVPTPSRTTLEAKVQGAWMALRGLAPGIACKCFTLPPPDGSFAFRYTVPSSPKDAEDWAQETVFFHDEVKSMCDMHGYLKDNHWWLPSANHYVAELHVSKSEKGWTFSMSLLHSMFDGRAAFSMVDLYLKLLTMELEGKAKSASLIKWGIETIRLQAPGPFTVSIAETGNPPEIDEPPVQMADKKVTAEEKPVLKPWLYAPVRANAQGDVSRIVTFSRETTSKLHAAAKAHGRTITQLFTALYILAHTEAALRTASAQGTDRFREVSSTFKGATHYLIAWTFMNHRHKFPGGYHDYESQRGSPLLAQDGTAPVLPMDVVRSVFKLDETTQSISRVIDGHAFWDGLVTEVASTWKAIDQSLEAYLSRERAGHTSSDKFDPAAFHIPALIISSIGDLGRLGILTNYLPSSSEPEHWPMAPAPTLAVMDVVTGLRARLPVTVNLLYQYDGQLSSHFTTAGEYTSEKSLQLETDIFQEWVDILVAGL